MTIEYHDRNLISFAEEVMNLVQRTRTVSTYKYAVLLGMIDLCIERRVRHGDDGESITTRQLAEKVTELYWPQTLPYKGDGDVPLKQSSGSHTRVIKLITDFKATLSDSSITCFKARDDSPDRFKKLLDEIEWTLIKMPLPKLQRLDQHVTEILYSITWDDDIYPGPVNRYQAGKEGSGFDNVIRFKPDVPGNLVALSALLRPLIHTLWATQVSRFNKRRLEESQLQDYLFGAKRISLKPVKTEIKKLCGEKCFYCGEPLPQSYEIDHFIPWARYPDNGILNLVAADRTCNGNKSDFVASVEHLEKWMKYTTDKSSRLEEIAKKKKWEHNPEKTLGVAKSIYSGLSGDALLWRGVDDFTRADRVRIGRNFQRRN